ncbi:UNVERIFIED_CONTAM: membrane protein, partial [Mumia flava]
FVVAVLLGATLSRAIVGASPFVATISASLALVAVHRLLGWACVRLPQLERFIAGRQREVYREGRFNQGEMDAALITVGDVQESVRQTLGARTLDDVEAAILERNGQVSLIRKRR